MYNFVRAGPRLTDKKVGQLQPGAVVTVQQEMTCNRHARVCIGDGQWISRVNNKGVALANPYHRPQTTPNPVAYDAQSARIDQPLATALLATAPSPPPAVLTPAKTWDMDEIKIFDKVCKRSKTSAVGVVLKKHESLQMVQIDFSESGGAKYEWMKLVDLAEPRASLVGLAEYGSVSASTGAQGDSFQQPQSTDVGAALGPALAQVNLAQFEHALRELGVSTCADLVDIAESDCIEMGMKKLEVKRLMRLINQ